MRKRNKPRAGRRGAHALSTWPLAYLRWLRFRGLRLTMAMSNRRSWATITLTRAGPIPKREGVRFPTATQTGASRPPNSWDPDGSKAAHGASSWDPEGSGRPTALAPGIQTVRRRLTALAHGTQTGRSAHSWESVVTHGFQTPFSTDSQEPAEGGAGLARLTHRNPSGVGVRRACESVGRGAPSGMGVRRAGIARVFQFRPLRGT